MGSFYGDPDCGLIDQNNQWCLVGGSALILWNKKKILEINDANLCWIYAVRQTDANKVQILTDPFANNSAVWELDTLTTKFRKIRDFDNYKNKKYTDIIEW